MVGLDTLTLTGKELGIADSGQAMAKAVVISRDAARQGAIITLSAHMPNFDSPNEHGTPCISLVLPAPSL